MVSKSSSRFIVEKEIRDSENSQMQVFCQTQCKVYTDKNLEMGNPR